MSNRDTSRYRSEHPAPPCSGIQDLLPAYVSAQARGQRPDAIYPAVAAHLSSCADCRAAFDELQSLAIEAYTGAVEPAPSYPQPDLSFLPAQIVKPVTAQPWRIDEWGRVIVAFSQALLDSLRPPALLSAARGQVLYAYALPPQALPGTDVNIEVLAANMHAGLGFVRVNVESLDRDPFDQAPSRVVARTTDAIWEGTTDETGCVAFDAVPLAALPSLTIEIASDHETDSGSASG